MSVDLNVVTSTETPRIMFDPVQIYGRGGPAKLTHNINHHTWELSSGVYIHSP